MRLLVCELFSAGFSEDINLWQP